MTCPPNAFRTGEGGDPPRAGRVVTTDVGDHAVVSLPAVSDRRAASMILGWRLRQESAPRRSCKDADADVVLVDRHDYHTFQPLLYQVATGLLETTAVGHSLRDLLERPATTRRSTRRP